MTKLLSEELTPFSSYPGVTKDDLKKKVFSIGDIFIVSSNYATGFAFGDSNIEFPCDEKLALKVSNEMTVIGLFSWYIDDEILKAMTKKYAVSIEIAMTDSDFFFYERIEDGEMAEFFEGTLADVGPTISDIKGILRMPECYYRHDDMTAEEIISSFGDEVLEIAKKNEESGKRATFGMDKLKREIYWLITDTDCEDELDSVFAINELLS